MGNSTSTLSSQYLYDLQEYEYQKRFILFDDSLGNARFLKTIQFNQNGHLYAIKIFVKPTADADLQRIVKRLEIERDMLFDMPNCLPFSRIIETERVGYVVRQYLYSNLYDRISEQPFLNQADKLWICYQMISAVKQSHSKGIIHGDVKLQNFLCTGWNWIYLTDFASFKPISLPLDNPADFTFFFDTSGRRACSIAPERFNNPTKFEPEMDIFSLGCAIAQLYSEGKPLFTYSQLLKYLKNEFLPTIATGNQQLDQLVLEMINVNPSKRQSASFYLEHFFPNEFNELHIKFSKISQVQVSEYASDQQLLLAQSIDLMSTNIKLQTSVLVTSLIRGLLKPSSCIKALSILCSSSQGLSDDVVLDRILPYILQSSTLASPKVKAKSVKVISELLGRIQAISTSNLNYLDYVYSFIQDFAIDPSEFVRVTYASCLGKFMQISSKFQQFFILARNENFSNHFIKDLETLLKDPSSSVKRALLSDISTLVVNLKTRQSIDLVLSHSIPYVNDEDPLLKVAFFDQIIALSTFLGQLSFDEFIIPLLLQSLVDSNELILERVLNSLLVSCELKLTKKTRFKEILNRTLQLIYHPNQLVRTKCLELIVSMSENASSLEFDYIIHPLIRDFVKCDIPSKPTLELLQMITKKPIDRKLLQMSLMGASISNNPKLLVMQSWLVRASQSFKQQEWTRKLSEMYNEMNSITPTTVFLSMPSEYAKIPVAEYPLTSKMQRSNSQVNLVRANTSFDFQTIAISNQGQEPIFDTIKYALKEKAYELFPKPLQFLEPIVPILNESTALLDFNLINTLKQPSPVRQLLSSSDCTFLASISQDSIRIFDCSKLENSVIKPVHTLYDLVTAACMITQTFSIAFASHGTLKIFHQNLELVNGQVKFSGFNQIYEHLIVENEAIHYLDHMNSELESIIACCCSSRVVFWDLRSNSQISQIEIPPKIGKPTCLKLFQRNEKSICLIGTANGYLIWFNVIDGDSINIDMETAGIFQIASSLKSENDVYISSTFGDLCIFDLKELKVRHWVAKNPIDRFSLLNQIQEFLISNAQLTKRIQKFHLAISQNAAIAVDYYSGKIHSVSDSLTLVRRDLKTSLVTGIIETLVPNRLLLIADAQGFIYALK